MAGHIKIKTDSNNHTHFDLLINEERAIATGSVTAFQQQTGKPQIGYYEFVRPVASATAVNLNYTSGTAANTILFSVWYV